MDIRPDPSSGIHRYNGSGSSTPLQNTNIKRPHSLYIRVTQAKLKQWKTVGEVGGKKRTAEYVYKSVEDILEEGKFRKIKKDETKASSVKVKYFIRLIKKNIYMKIYLHIEVRSYSLVQLARYYISVTLLEVAFGHLLCKLKSKSGSL